MTRSPGSPSPARAVATRVLFRVAEEGAWATPALDAEIARSARDPRDAALATEIAYGALRVVPSLDAAIARCLDRPDRTLEPFARAALRAAAYQLRHLEVPDHAIVSDAVAIVRAARGAGLSGFVNAVSRRLAKGRPAERRPPERVELPGWLETALEGALGAERARALTTLRELPPPMGLRVVTERISRAELAQRIMAHAPRASVREGDAAPEALLVRRAGDPRELPGWRAGLFTVQEQGSQVVAALVGAREGERVLDACAGRGGKTAVLAARVGDAGRVVAVDLHEAKLERIAEELHRLRLPRARVETHCVDLTVGTGGLDGGFDRVLVDAPCTGLGTVQRRPEILLRTGPTDPARLGEAQRAILKNAAKLLRPGGRLVYAVCSPMREEGAEVVGPLAAEGAALSLEGTPGADDDGLLRIGPWLDDCDAYQVAVLSKTEQLEPVPRRNSSGGV